MTKKGSRNEVAKKPAPIKASVRSKTPASKCRWKFTSWQTGEQCMNKPKKNKQYCGQHDHECSYDDCKKRATQGCSAAGSFVCGVPVCDDHGPNCERHS